MSRKKTIVVLASGGFDSNVLIATLLKKYDRVWPLYIRSGFVWEKTEIYWLRRYLKAMASPKLKDLTILNMPFADLDSQDWAVTGRQTPDDRSRDKEVYLPGRNLLLLSKASVFCALNHIPEVAIGSLSGNPFPDATKSFFKGFGRLVSQALGQPLMIRTPFLNKKKKDLLRMGKRLPLHLSFSCLNPIRLRPCRRCNKCAERQKVWHDF